MLSLVSFVLKLSYDVWKTYVKTLDNKTFGEITQALCVLAKFM